MVSSYCIVNLTTNGLIISDIFCLSVAQVVEISSFLSVLTRSKAIYRLHLGEFYHISWEFVDIVGQARLDLLIYRGIHSYFMDNT